MGGGVSEQHQGVRAGVVAERHQGVWEGEQVSGVKECWWRVAKRQWEVRAGDR